MKVEYSASYAPFEYRIKDLHFTRPIADKI